VARRIWGREGSPGRMSVRRSVSSNLERDDAARTNEGNPEEAVKAVLLSCFYLQNQHTAGESGKTTGNRTLRIFRAASSLAT
jgi:organic hydroperoxide reductase OsmC/OhrA